MIERVLPARLDVHRDVARRVAGRRLEPDLVGDPVVGRHEVGEAGVDDRAHRVVDRRRVARSRLRGPSAPTRRGTAGSARSGTWAPSRRRRASCSSPRGRSGGGCRSRCRPPRAGSRRRRGRTRNGVCRLSASMPGSLPVVADAGVDDDPAVADGDAERVDRQHEVAVVVDEVRAQPRRVRRDDLVGRAGQEPAGRDVGRRSPRRAVMVTSPIVQCRLSAIRSPVADGQMELRPSASMVTNCSMRRAARLGTLGVVDPEQDRVAVRAVKPLRTRGAPWRSAGGRGSGRRAPRSCADPA